MGGRARQVPPRKIDKLPFLLYENPSRLQFQKNR